MTFYDEVKEALLYNMEDIFSGTHKDLNTDIFLLDGVVIIELEDDFMMANYLITLNEFKKKCEDKQSLDTFIGSIWYYNAMEKDSL